jgi:protein involved in polysaccharide export with SLBB domain
VMTRRMRAASLTVCLAAIGAGAPAQAPLQMAETNINSASPVADYRIGAGDELSVTFPYNAELNHDGPVGPDGRFSLPLIGSIALAGDTVTQATDIIRNALRDAGIVENAYPSVTVRRYGTNVYVGGEVHTPGVVQLAAGMDALQAVIVAGGLLESAKTGQIAIIRHDAENRPHITYVDLHGYTRGKANAKVATLEPRDVVFVPKSKIAEVDTWIDDYINKTLPFSRGLNYTYANYPATAAVVTAK